MATEKQIAANKANAQKSTGPKTAAGKLRSSRNAYRHGLSCPLRFDPIFSAKVNAISRALGEEIKDFACAQLELQRIRSTRVGLMEKFDFNQPDTQTLQRVAALDRYERYAETRRRRAGSKL